LRKLRDATGHTVHLAARQGDEMIYLARLDDQRAYQKRSHAGLTIPKHCTAVRKCLLAALPESEVRSIIERTGLPRRTDRTITDLELLLAHLETVRRNGFALDHEENEADVRCVGALVVDSRGSASAGVSVSSLSFDVNATKIRRHSKLVIAVAHEISLALGAPPTAIAP
jgi:IclR family acetate operon transcriptional repressor